MQNIHQILIKYWGYSSFRPLQEDIINSVLSGKDTLALLPTGGGKSICFQVPALAKEGICIVVSPLIALIKDQVENLRKKNIPSIAIYSGMTKKEIDIALDNCIYGNFKFLYLSPERLISELTRARIAKMNVNLLAVDEAHCVSQWGYDFRPPYLRIPEIRGVISGNIPVLALTATATPEVVEDIQDKLHFRVKNVLQKSFERKNLAYVVLYEENKLNRLLKIAEKLKGTGIVYVRNRKKTAEIAQFLKKNGIEADYYHAGLDNKERSIKQDNWIKNKTRIIVSTNAFGMGIDKPDVRFVVHLDLPDSLEAYFQEAGRGGRDEKKAYAVLLYSESDRIELEERIISAFPPIDTIKNVYHAIGNYFELAIGSGEGFSYNFEINDFCKKFNFDLLSVYNSIGFLEKENYITATEAVFMPARIKITTTNENLYKFQVANKQFDELIKILLRSYTGLFDNYIKINETEIATRFSVSTEQLIQLFKLLESYDILSYLPASGLPQITFNTGRVDKKDLRISKENYTDRKNTAIQRMESVIYYVTTFRKCRSQMLLAYFGDENSVRCGVCDVCLERNKLELSNVEFENVSEQIKKILSEKPVFLNELVNQVQNSREDKIIKVLQWLVDNGKVEQKNNGNLVWVK